MNKNYRYFLTVAHELNIKHIKKLESDIGVSLFHRRSKGVELTEYGRMFKSYAQEQQEKHAQLMHRFTDMQQRRAYSQYLVTPRIW